MIRSLSNVSLNEERNYKFLQRRLLRTLMNVDEPAEIPNVDLPDVVCILKSLGYHIRKIDVSCPDDIFLLRNHEKGTRIVVTCLHSGTRCVLERPDAKENCRCLIKADERDKDVFWEVSATTASTQSLSKGESIIETGCDLTPNVSKELYALIQDTLANLINMIRETNDNTGMRSRASSTNSQMNLTSLLNNTSTKGATSSPNDNPRRLSGYLRDMNPPIIINSPIRSKSFDPLPEPECVSTESRLTPKKRLDEKDNMARSSPNIHLAVTHEEDNNSSTSTLGNNNLDKVTELLVTAIRLIGEQKGQQISPATFNSILTNKSRKSPNRVSATSETPKKPKPAVPRVSSLSTSVSAVKSKPLAKPTVKAVAPKRSVSVVEPKMAKTVLSTKLTQTKTEPKKPLKKINNLYAHVKSTIPKPASK